MKAKHAWLGCFLYLCLFASQVQSRGRADMDTYTQTRHPIVLVHGLSGFDTVAGVLPYWFLIDDALRRGGATVYVANLSSFNSSEVRGEQLIHYLEGLQAAGGHERFNLIGHSQGSPTARYVASTRPDLVASVTAVGGANQGSPIVDLTATVFPPGSAGEGIAAAVTRALGELLELLSGDDDIQDPLAAFHALSTPGAESMNARYPEGLPASPCGEGEPMVNGIYYASFSGTGVMTNPWDPADYVLALTGQVFQGEPNDGLVGRCHSHLGEVLRDDYPWNHMDEVNFLFGLRGAFTPDVPTVYRQHANRLRNMGL